jgi:hypothetical protein
VSWKAVDKPAKCRGWPEVLPGLEGGDPKPGADAKPGEHRKPADAPTPPADHGNGRTAKLGRRARNAWSKCNDQSIKENKEYHGCIYKDADGKYYCTGPIKRTIGRCIWVNSAGSERNPAPSEL